MQLRLRAFLCILVLAISVATLARQTSAASQGKAPAKAPAAQDKKPPAQAAPKTAAEPEPTEPQEATPGPDVELQLAVQQAAGDQSALILNLEGYLQKYPDSPRRAAIYRALLDSATQLQNPKLAIAYADKLLAIQPDDSQTLFLAVTILNKMADDVSLGRAIDYDTRLIDRVAKADPESRPPQMTLDEWQSGRDKFSMSLFGLRGRMERRLHKNDEAAKDFTQSFFLLPNASAAMNLGEVAEEQKRADEAIRQYTIAFLLADPSQEENNISRDSLRLKMGNLWRFTHDTDTGLGDILLSSFDKNHALVKADRQDPVVYNKGITDPAQFSMRRVDGGDPFKLPDARGKTVVLNFWTTWCAYCRTIEPNLDAVRAKFAGRNDVVFLAVNADEEEILVAPHMQSLKIGGTLVFADGLDSVLHVQSIPTIVVLDRNGKVTYRTQGYLPDGFADALSGAIAKSSGGTGQ